MFEQDAELETEADEVEDEAIVVGFVNFRQTTWTLHYALEIFKMWS